MRKLFDSELHRLGDLLVEMTDKAKDAVADATEALLSADLVLAESVIDRDETLDALQREVDALGLETIALQQPVATDLRIVFTAIRMATTLERMGDLATHVAKQARRRYPEASIPQSLHGTFAEMGEIAVSLAADSAAVIASRDLDLAGQIAVTDRRLDELHRQVFATMLSPNWQEDTATTIDVTLCSRFFERFGDHAVSLAERVHYLVTGQVEKAAASSPVS